MCPCGKKPKNPRYKVCSKASCFYGKFHEGCFKTVQRKNDGSGTEGICSRRSQRGYADGGDMLTMLKLHDVCGTCVDEQDSAATCALNETTVYPTATRMPASASASSSSSGHASKPAASVSGTRNALAHMHVLTPPPITPGQEEEDLDVTIARAQAKKKQREEAKLREHTAAMSQLQRENTQLREQLETRMEKERAEVSQLTLQNTQLTDKVQERVQERVQRTAEMSQLQTKNTQLMEQHKAHKAKIAALQGQNAQLDAQLGNQDTLQVQNGQLQLQVQQANTLIEQLKPQLVEQREEIKRLRLRNDELDSSRKLAEQESDRDKQQLAVMGNMTVNELINMNRGCKRSRAEGEETSSANRGVDGQSHSSEMH
jgi:hypothetical protein